VNTHWCANTSSTCLRFCGSCLGKSIMMVTQTNPSLPVYLRRTGKEKWKQGHPGEQSWLRWVGVYSKSSSVTSSLSWEPRDKVGSAFVRTATERWPMCWTRCFYSMPVNVLRVCVPRSPTPDSSHVTLMEFWVVPSAQPLSHFLQPLSPVCFLAKQLVPQLFLRGLPGETGPCTH
jgi:hypothetical protein